MDTDVPGQDKLEKYLIEEIKVAINRGDSEMVAAITAFYRAYSHGKIY